jgi:hypothetical protein
MPIGVGRDRLFVIQLHKEFPLLEFTSENAFNFTPPVVTSYTGSAAGVEPVFTDGEQPCVGGGNRLIYGKHFGMFNLIPDYVLNPDGFGSASGADISGNPIRFYAGFGDYKCKSTTYVNDSMLRCVEVPIGAGAKQDIW